MSLNASIEQAAREVVDAFGSRGTIIVTGRIAKAVTKLQAALSAGCEKWTHGDAWRFACQWYTEDEIFRSIQNGLKVTSPVSEKIPTDVRSREFAKWLTDQYRLAMNKGIQIGSGGSPPKGE